jgi:uncharacterized protein (UPF0335 family)
MASVKLSDTLYYGIHPTTVLPNYPVDHFVDLTEVGEVPFFKPVNATYHSFPIKDRTSVSVEELSHIVDYINNLDGVVYISCRGGHGRSGMVVAAVHGKRNGLIGKEALDEIQKEWSSQRDMTKLRKVVRKFGSPQTIAQKAVVVEYLERVERVEKVEKGLANRIIEILERSSTPSYAAKELDKIPSYKELLILCRALRWVSQYCLAHDVGYLDKANFALQALTDMKPDVVCLKVSNLRELGYSDLRDWLKYPENIYTGRANRIWIHKDGEKDIFHFPGSKWANPYNLNEYDLNTSLTMYKLHINESGLIEDIDELRGKNLGCFCVHKVDKGRPVCHAQVLADLLHK